MSRIDSVDQIGAIPVSGQAARSILYSKSARFLFILGQLGLLAIIIRQFQIESSAFLRVALVAFLGYAVHALLPVAYRLQFFVLLSLGTIILVMGPQAGGVLIALGSVLIITAHLPVSFRTRAALLVALGAGLALARVEVVEVPVSMAIWPILASMFMFRLIVYLYDLKHDKEPPSLWRTLAYFFMLPNICFPFFPVVDFKTFRRTYHDKEAFDIHQVGIDWMVRGVTHLILYRIIYLYLALAPSEVVTTSDLVQYLVFNFLLYLRVSGQFHLIIGMLHLFGFNLPETNHKYCLATSFTDFWRRINIYWKDFMMKIFYYPVFLRLKKYGETQAIVLATFFVFAVTWFLHSYQWFWLRGSFPVTWQDGVFWIPLASLVIVNALYEMKYGRKRTLKPPTWTPRRVAMTALKTIGTFSVVVVLWSLWTAESWAAWVSLWTPLETPPSSHALLGSIVVIGVVIGNSGPRGVASLGRKWSLPSRATIVLVLLALLGLPQFYTNLPHEVASFVVLLKSNQLSRLDRAALERGYYEQLTRVDRFNSQLWEVYAHKPLHWLDPQGAGLVRFTGDFAETELVPSLVSTNSFSTITTNRWGMRDKDYEKEPAPDTYRMTLLGASTTMGWGVEDGEAYEALVEDALNRDLPQQGGYAQYEILNLGVPGHYPLQKTITLEKALSFKPRVVIYEAVGDEFSHAAYRLAEVTHKRTEIPYPLLQAVADHAGLEPGMSEEEARKRLRPFQKELIDWLYGHLAARIRSAGALPVWAFASQIYSSSVEKTIDPAKQLAERHGFITIDLRGAYAGKSEEDLRLAEWDSHPNALGHRLLAEALYREIRAKEDQLTLQPSKEEQASWKSKESNTH